MAGVVVRLEKGTGEWGLEGVMSVEVSERGHVRRGKSLPAELKVQNYSVY